MRKFWIFCAILGCKSVCKANDANAEGIGGRWRFVKGEHRHIRMVSERVAMTIGAKGGDLIVADFVFHNDGPKASVTMGFPEKSDGVGYKPQLFRHHSAFHNFASWVDGKPVKTKRVFDLTDGGDNAALWLKTVNFAAHQTRHVRVRYQAPGYDDSLGFVGQTYRFSGGNWKGNVAESVLTVDFRLPGTWWAKGSYDQTPTLRQTRNHLEYRWHNWQAQSDFDFLYRSTLFGALKRSDDSEEFLVLHNPSKFRRGQILQVVDEPPAVREGKNLWVLVEWLCEPLKVEHTAEISTITDQIDGTWDAKTKFLTLQRDARKVKINAAGALVNSYASLHRAGVPFYARQFGELRLYIPVSSLQPLRVAFSIDAKQNTISKRGLK